VSSIVNKNISRAFTLVEVMVALAVVAVALPALMFALFQQIDGTAYLRDKSLAHMVAANQLTEIRILAEATRRLPEGSDSGVREMAGREWYWWRQSSKTELPNFYRIEIRVARAEADEPLITLAAFLSSDLEVDTLAGDRGGEGDE
jgi:general secretion pathway protein I